MIAVTNPEIQQSEDINQYPLTSVYFYLSEGCNLSCSHCWLSPSNNPEGKNFTFLSLEIFQKIINEAKPLGLESVKLTGGEPLLHPDIMAMLDIVYKEGLELIMETNGILCTQEIADQVSRQSNPFVSVSLDGADAEIHDRLRGKQDSFQHAVQAIERLAGNNVQTQIIMSLMRDNVHQLEDMITLSEKLQVGSLKFNLVQPVGRGKDIHATGRSISIPELITLGRKVETDLQANTAVTLVFDIPPAFKPLKQFASGSKGCDVCNIFSILGVLADGRYALCGIGSRVKNLVFGHAVTDSLVDVWRKNPLLQEIHQNLPGKLTGICRRCLMKSLCMGCCIAHNYYSSGSLWSPFWFCAQAEKKEMFPPSRLS